MEKRCETCRFWEMLDDPEPKPVAWAGEGFCRRFPPIGAPANFPITQYINWCGEHQDKE